jgi:hypothetical protein
MHFHTASYANGVEVYPRMLASGITGLRDMGSPVDDILRLRDEIIAGALAGPRMVLCGPLLIGPYAIDMPLVRSAFHEEEARQSVIELKERGVDFIKVNDSLPRSYYYAIADQAKRSGIPFCGHIPPVISAVEAIQAGQHSVEHLGGQFYGMLLACSTREAELTALVQKILDDQIKAVASGKDPDESALFKHDLTRPLVESFYEEKARGLIEICLQMQTAQVPTLLAQPLRTALTNQMPGLTEEDRHWGQALLRQMDTLTFEMVLAGVQVMAGTDVPAGNPDTTLHQELALLHQAGLTPLQVLQAATTIPVQFLGQEGQYGAIEEGKQADLVLLGADPLSDITNTQTVELTVIRGKIAWQK